MAERKQLLAAGAVLAAGTALVLLARAGKTPAISLQEQAVGQSYSPFVFWMHQNPKDWFHQFPATIGANTLPQPYQTEDMGQALKQVETEVIDSAGCAQ